MAGLIWRAKYRRRTVNVSTTGRPDAVWISDSQLAQLFNRVFPARSYSACCTTVQQCKPPRAHSPTQASRGRTTLRFDDLPIPTHVSGQNHDRDPIKFSWISEFRNRNELILEESVLSRHISGLWKQSRS